MRKETRPLVAESAKVPGQAPERGAAPEGQRLSNRCRGNVCLQRTSGDTIASVSASKPELPSYGSRALSEQPHQQLRPAEVPPMSLGCPYRSWLDA